MIRLTRSRRRVAALASTALAAGALAVMPLGLESASAAPVTTSMTCQISGTFPQTLATSTLATTLTAPATAPAGGSFDATLAYTLTMTNAAFGPIDNIAGDVDFIVDVGGTQTPVSVPFTTWTSGAPAFSGSATVGIHVPDNVDLQNVKVVSAYFDSTAHVNAGPPGGVNTPFDVPCTPNEGATTKLGSVSTTKTVAYTCVMTQPGGAQTNIPSALTIQMDTPDAITAGESYEPSVKATLDMGNTYMGPVTFNGSIDLDLMIGSKATTVAVPIATNTPGGSPMVPPHVVFTGAKAVKVDAPETTGSGVAITLGNAKGNFTGTVSGSTIPSPIPCTVNGSPTASLNTTNVEAKPAGLKYTCAYQAWTFPAYAQIAPTTPLPASVKEDAVLNPALTTTLTWGRFWTTSSRNIQAAYKDGTGVIDTTATAGSGALTFTSTPVPATGPMVWTGTGTYGVVNTAAAGTADLALGNLSLAMQTSNQFTDGFAKATMNCVLDAGQDASLGSVVIEDVPDITATAKVTGAAKVGQKLTASATTNPATATKSYQWLRNGAAISGAKAAGYTAVPADLGKSLSVRITATQAGYDSRTVTVAAGKVAAGTQVVSGKAKIIGKAKVGKKLTAVPGKATGATVKYQWLSNGKVIKKATAKSLKLTKALKGKKVSVKVSYVRTGYTTVTQATKALKIK